MRLVTDPRRNVPNETLSFRVLRKDASFRTARFCQAGFRTPPMTISSTTLCSTCMATSAPSYSPGHLLPELGFEMDEPTHNVRVGSARNLLAGKMCSTVFAKPDKRRHFMRVTCDGWMGLTYLWGLDRR